MASNRNHGLAVGISNFEKLINYCLSFEADYHPIKPSLAIAAMQAQALQVREHISLVSTCEPVYKAAVSERRAAFKKQEKIITRITNAVKVSNTTSDSIEPILSIVRKLQGRRASPKMTDEQKKTVAEADIPVIEISHSQMSYDSRLYNLDKLIKLLQNLAAYQPFEEELSINALIALYDELQSKNKAVAIADITLSNACIVRNDAIYKEHSGMMDTAQEAKLYIKSVFGASSPQFKMVSKLIFKKYKL